VRIDETYIKIRGQWRYLYRAIDKHGTPVDFLLRRIGQPIAWTADATTRTKDAAANRTPRTTGTIMYCIARHPDQTPTYGLR
jgi:hypothetical protein